MRIDSAWPEQSWIDQVWSWTRCNDENSCSWWYTIQITQKLVDNSICNTCSRRVSSWHNRLELVKKYDWWGYTQSLFKHLSHCCFTTTNVFAQNVWTLNRKEFHGKFVLNWWPQSCLSVSCCPVQKNSSWDFDLYLVINKPILIGFFNNASNCFFGLLKSNYFIKIIFPFGLFLNRDLFGIEVMIERSQAEWLCFVNKLWPPAFISLNINRV